VFRFVLKTLHDIISFGDLFIIHKKFKRNQYLIKISLHLHELSRSCYVSNGQSNFESEDVFFNHFVFNCSKIKEILKINKQIKAEAHAN
jgi:hypothetical protein